MARQFTQAEKIKMLMAAFDLCPRCQKQFLEYASGQGSDPIRFMREMLWKLWGQWDHGEACPQPEAPAGVSQGQTAEQGTGSGSAEALALPRQVPAPVLKSQEHVTGFERDLVTMGESIA